MLKVIFKVEKLVLRLKRIQCQIIAKKDSYIIPLSPVMSIYNGEVLIDTETEFFIIQKDPLFLIQVSLHNQGHKKLGGEVCLNPVEWDQNVHHSTVASLRKSPDRYSQLFYTFIYIKKDLLSSQKTLILCSEYRDQNLTQIQGKKNELTRKQNKLQDQIKKLKQESQTLQIHQKIKIEEINNKRKDFDSKIKTYQQSIDQNNFKNDFLKKRNEEIVRMIQMYGKEDIKLELESKYPQQRQGIQEESSIGKRKTSGAKYESDSNSSLANKSSVSQVQRRRPCEDRERSREKRKVIGSEGN